MNNLFSPESAWLSFGLGVVLMVVYGDHLWHVIRQWRVHRDSRSLHHVLLGMVIEIGMVAIVAGRGVSVGLWGEALYLVLGSILTGSLLLVGIYLTYSWHGSGKNPS